MASEDSSAGSVFISYAREDRARVEPIPRYLNAAGIDVWWDQRIEVGSSFRFAIQTALDEAACVLVLWTTHSVQKPFVHSEASMGQQRGILKPALLDAKARIPVGFTELQYFDLTQWNGSDDAPLEVLARTLKALVARGPNKLRYGANLDASDWILSGSQNSVVELGQLTTQIRSISHLFVSPSAPTKDLRDALGEVSKTYAVVRSAILRFVKPAVGTRPISPAPYVKMERGPIRDAVERGRGHCGLILMHYGKYGGLRDWIAERVPPAQLEAMDDVFSSLGTADGDLFRPLVEIGDILTNESRLIANLLLSGQEQLARARILEGRQKLAPLEDQLAKAMRDLQEIEASLGYTETSS